MKNEFLVNEKNYSRKGFKNVRVYIERSSKSVGEANNALFERLGMTLNKLHLEFCSFIDNSVTAKTQTLYDRVLAVTIDIKDEALND